MHRERERKRRGNETTFFFLKKRKKEKVCVMYELPKHGIVDCVCKQCCRISGGVEGGKPPLFVEQILHLLQYTGRSISYNLCFFLYY